MSIISQDEFTHKKKIKKCKDCDCFLEYESFKDNLIRHKYHKDYSNKIDDELKKQFKNTFKFSNSDINISILLLRKGVYP